MGSKCNQCSADALATSQYKKKEAKGEDDSGCAVASLPGKEEPQVDSMHENVGNFVVEKIWESRPWHRTIWEGRPMLDSNPGG